MTSIIREKLPSPADRTAYDEDALAFLLSAIEARLNAAAHHLKHKRVATAEVSLGWAIDAVVEARRMELPK